MRAHENISQSLKNRQFHLCTAWDHECSTFDLAVRFSLKDLEKDFAQTENDIKAVQSVGQIIGEVMKQLDDERCA